ncbi:MAG: hypothetical protein J0H68_09650 [Sphingobacteriia bacterium]|nr:hypothetical protein [Sphingobacteriia bacterium]
MQIIDDTKENSITLFQTYIKEARLNEILSKNNKLLTVLLGFAFLVILVLGLVIAAYKPKPLFVILSDTDSVAFKVMPSIEEQGDNERNLTIKYFLRKYVQNRHGIEGFNKDIQRVAFLKTYSDPELLKSAAKEYNDYINKLSNYKRKVVIKSATLLSNNTAVIDFDTIDVSPNEKRISKSWKAEIGFELQGERIVTHERADSNPIGLLITSYTIEAKNDEKESD